MTDDDFFNDEDEEPDYDPNDPEADIYAVFNDN